MRTRLLHGPPLCMPAVNRRLRKPLVPTDTMPPTQKVYTELNDLYSLPSTKSGTGSKKYSAIGNWSRL